MIRVTIRNIIEYGLPLDSDYKVMSRGCSKEVLKSLEKKYKCKTEDVCRRSGFAPSAFQIYENVIYNHIPEKDKDKWIVNYEVYIRSSFAYKYWIFVRKFNKLFH